MVTTDQYQFSRHRGTKTG